MSDIETFHQNRDKTVLVLGAGFAGLMIAARLLDLGFRVMVVERDDLDIATGSRPIQGQPSRRLPAIDFNHVLMGEALDQLIDWWPGYADELHGADVPIYTLKDWMSEEQLAESADGDDDKPLAACLSRVLLERLWRARLLKQAHCRIIDGSEVIGLSGYVDGECYHVSGVRIKRRGEVRNLRADAIIDAMGRESQWLAWAKEVGAGGVEYPWPNTRQIVASHYEVNSSRHFLLSRHVFGFMNTLAIPAEGKQVCLMLDIPRQEERFWRALWANDNFESALQGIPEFKEWFEHEELQPVGPIVGYSAPHWWRRSLLDGEKPVLVNYFPVGDALMSINPSWLLGSLIAVKTAKAVTEALCQGVGVGAAERYGRAIDVDLASVMTKVRQIESMVESLSDAQHQGAAIPLSVSLLHETYFGLHHLARSDKNALRVVIRSEMWLDDPVAAYQNPVRWLRHWRRWVKWRLQDEDGDFRLPDRRDILSKVGAA